MDTEQKMERDYCRLVRKLMRITVELETIGATDMGLLQQRLASRFHNITSMLHDLTNELTEDVLWPHEPHEWK